MEEIETYNRLSGRRNLYRISQTVNSGYDTYSDAVVATWTEVEARNTHLSWSGAYYAIDKSWDLYSWTEPQNVDVELIGIGEPGIEGVVCASYHAG